jgi:flagellar biosynthesis anti-sigma factor FlgM
MDPTRSIDPKKTLRPPGQKPTAPTAGPTTASGARPASSSGDQVSVEVSDVGFARAEAKRIDAQRLEALREALSSGTYEVDPDALARRIVDDALGPEAFE